MKWRNLVIYTLVAFLVVGGVAMAIEVPDWYRTVALVGQDETGTPRVVLLDSEGHIIAIIKGEYAGILKNIAVDAEGRMIMIPTDPADVWGNAISAGNIEVIRAFTFLKRYDGRGTTFWWSDFENGLQGILPYVDNSASTVEISANRSNNGAFSLKCDPREAADSYAGIRRLITPLVNSRIGVEVSSSFDPSPVYFFVRIGRCDGTNKHYGFLRYTHSSGEWKIYDENGVYQTILTNEVLQTGAASWSTMKLVVDFTADKYTRALIGSHEVDLSAFGLRVAADPSVAQIEIMAYVWGSAAAHGPWYIDDLIVTQNEPE